MAITEQWDGSSWTEVGDLVTAIRYTQGAGSVSSGIQMFGYTTARSAVTQEWEFYIDSCCGCMGIRWRHECGRYRMGSAGTRDAALAFGGNKDPGQANETESYNGSSWTELSNLNTARSENGGCGPQTAALCIAGSTSGRCR